MKVRKNSEKFRKKLGKNSEKNSKKNSEKIRNKFGINSE